MSAREAWLKEHESVQDELSRMKQELMGDLIEKMKEAKKEQAPRLTGNENIKTLLAGKGDSLVSRSKPVDTDIQKTPPTRKPKDGEIPKHPELSNFVARVMEKEHTINRKIFEKEKEYRNEMAVSDGARIEETPESAAPPKPEVQDDKPKAPTLLMPVRRSFPPPPTSVSPPQTPSRIVDGSEPEPIPPVQPPIEPQALIEQDPISPPVQPSVEPQALIEQEPIPPVQPPIEPQVLSEQDPTLPPGSDMNGPEEVPGQEDGSGMMAPHPMGKVLVHRIIKKRE